ncbi:MAG: S-methyl-5-thioribose-1-phosphate isomerase [Thermoplasmata archaeon]|nr:S-methyl-5-thioribose-1-phosphate isomerase [Thermoplasmata archaeon]
MQVVVDGKVRDIKTVWMSNDVVWLIEQNLLPYEVQFFQAGTVEDVARAIETMVVRGAPAIGATAAYGIALAALKGEPLDEAAKRLKATRPTAYDLFYAIDLMLKEIGKGTPPVKAADDYAARISDMCRRIGENGDEVIRNGDSILTHCNAGALATVDHGTALAPMREAHRNGKRIFVYVDETRPRLQGAKLTAWELSNEGIDYAIIVDNAAGRLMQSGEIDLVIVGADRIAANGDVANKIGTYEKALIARDNSVPFYVAAPTSTIDFSLQDGRSIPIEERSESEVLHISGRRIAPKGAKARNPAFDVTSADLITGIITERGIHKPYELRDLRG